MKLRTNWRIAAQTVLVAFLLQTVAKAGPPGSAPALHFVCNIGYTLKQCHEAMDVLRKVLAKYPTADLGEWTWILVLPDDWGHIMQDRGWSPNRGPAFSILSLRETFLEGALVTKLSVRGDQLSTLWRMPIEDLLDLAVRHELGHALCNERNESKTDIAAIALKAGKPLSCQTTLVAKNP